MPSNKDIFSDLPKGPNVDPSGLRRLNVAAGALASFIKHYKELVSQLLLMSRVIRSDKYSELASVVLGAEVLSGDGQTLTTSTFVPNCKGKSVYGLSFLQKHAPSANMGCTLIAKNGVITNKSLDPSMGIELPNCSAAATESSSAIDMLKMDIEYERLQGCTDITLLTAKMRNALVDLKRGSGIQKN